MKENLSVILSCLPHAIEKDTGKSERVRPSFEGRRQKNENGAYNMANVGSIGAFLGGVLSSPSPCVLPLIPSYVSYITGISFEDFKTADKAFIRKLTLINSSAFVIGFSTIFILLGISSSFIGSLFSYYYDQIRIIGGIIIVILGLYVMGLLKLDFLASD